MCSPVYPPVYPDDRWYGQPVTSMIDTLRLESLPSVSAARAGATRVPWLWTMKTSVIVNLAGVGSIRLVCDGFAPADPTAREELMLVGGDGRRGRIAVERWFALALVAATLGWRTPRVLRALGHAERGVLAGQVAACLAQHDCPVAVSPDQPRASRDNRNVALALRAETSAMAGAIHVDIPPEWLAPGEVSPSRAAARDLMLRQAIGWLPISLSVELATTELPALDWAQARPGDAVVFTACPFLTGPQWPVSLRVGNHAADAITVGPGAVSFVGPFVAVASRAGARRGNLATRAPFAKEAGVMTVQPEDPSSPKLPASPSAPISPELTPSPESPSSPTLAAISAAPIEIVAEVGRLTLRGDEILGLHRGSVLTLGHHGQTVDLIVGGRRWAKGELVNVDGELGVRITELAPA